MAEDRFLELVAVVVVVVGVGLREEAALGLPEPERQPDPVGGEGETMHVLRETRGAQVGGSPGGLSGRNHDKDFELFRSGADACYHYSRARATRVRRLVEGWTLRAGVENQLASGTMVPTESSLPSAATPRCGATPE